MRHYPDCVPQEYGYPTAYYKRAGQQYASFSAADEAGLARVEVSPSGLVAKPAAYALEGAYPNPLQDRATIRFALPEASDVELIVYDALGRAVARLVDGRLEAGRHEAVFEAGALPPGLYVYELHASSFRETGRLGAVWCWRGSARMSPRQHRGSCLLRESERLKLNGDQPSPQIRFGLPERANVRLVVYDVMGREGLAWSMASWIVDSTASPGMRVFNRVGVSYIAFRPVTSCRRAA